MLLADVALPVPLAHAFTYAVPAELRSGVAVPGARVVCPFGSRRLVGVILALREGEPAKGTKALAAGLDREPTIPDELLHFLNDLASYYFAPIGEVMRLALPPEERAAAREVEEPTLFDAKKGLSARRVQWVLPLAAEGADIARPIAGQAAAVLSHVRATGETPLARLEERWGNARAAVKRLAEMGLVALESREAPRDPFFTEASERDVPPELTEPQARATEMIEESLTLGVGTTLLLHGVTGSGKTEVYLRAIVAARKARRGAIVLVPEIALTPQLVSRFRARFGDEVAVLHSALTPRERLDMWTRLRKGELDVAIGARSALFAPVKDLGLVVVDEEHDPSFKQEEGVRYHARDMAILRAHRVHGVCVLGSATPSLESEQLTRSGKATKLLLPDRARAQAMPKVEIIDLRRMGAGPTGDKRLSLPLHRALEATLAAKEQAILFLNRRGFAPSVRCEACGELVSCPSCSVALTHHKRGSARAGDEGARARADMLGVADPLRCHYCDFEMLLPPTCPKCKAPALALEGLGTERLEETLTTAFPEARVARLDRDVATGRTVDTILAKVRRREVDILVGTQMVTKGHDLPDVTLVGVINADAALSIPDFRAAERAFQLLVQVAGRAGRGEKPGKVLVQTYDPEHSAIVFATRHDVQGFLKRELQDREELSYPPFSRMALVRVDAVEERAAREASVVLARAAKSVASSPEVRVLGPAPAPLARLRGRFRYRVMIRAPLRSELRKVLRAVDAARADLPREVRASIDVDPVQLL